MMFPIVLGQFASLREQRLIWTAPFTRVHMFIGTAYNSDDVLIRYKVFRLEGDWVKVGRGGVSVNLQPPVSFRYKIS